jgi:hypothetical protein
LMDVAQGGLRELHPTPVPASVTSKATANRNASNCFPFGRQNCQCGPIVEKEVHRTHGHRSPLIIELPQRHVIASEVGLL